MTRKQALYRALQVLEDKETINKINEILNEMPFTHWSEKTIFDAIEQFILDNGRIPISKDFKKRNNMPPHPVIKLRFKMKVSEFLNKYYPCDKIYHSPYSYKTKEEWKDFFISEYMKNKPNSEDTYNKTRKEKTPTWDTIAKMFGKNTWLTWIEFCGLSEYISDINKKKGRVDLLVIPTIDLLLELQALEYQN